MRYIDFYENTEILHVGTMEPRAYYLPYAPGETLIYESKESSLRYKGLNGPWEFQYFSSVNELPYQSVLRVPEITEPSVLEVPSVWQMNGVDYHQYTNYRYPFPYDPPHVPYNNPCAIYKKIMRIDNWDRDTEYLLNFEGVDSCFFLWVNQEFAGYSQISHTTSEFDISAYVKDGDNNITVLVLKWCDGSYLEDQDKLRMSGIFRDVYLLARPQNHIIDFAIETHIDYERNMAEIHVELSTTSKGLPVKCSIMDEKGHVVARGHTTDQYLAVTVEHPTLWNSEMPYLYTVVLQTDQEHIAVKAGIREIKAAGGIVYLNRKKLNLKGVNRHDSSPYGGSAVTKEEIREDLHLMKLHNINAIRTSHYPPVPYLLELCDELGFYVMDEADIECHGVVSTCGDYRVEQLTLLADDPVYGKSILDRVQRLISRDKNFSSVIIWSVGNESGFGKNFEDALALVKRIDKTRLTHYENTDFPPDYMEPDYSNLDIYSRMYESLEGIEKYFSEGKIKKPFLQCEYVHAMGNGPGDIEDYYQCMSQFEQCLGGFVWEWCDHAVYDGCTDTGKKKFLYGGDFKEELHDGNFCLDGLVYPDRKVHTGLLEYKNVLRPIRVSLINKNRFLLKNMLDFTNLLSVYYVNYFVTCNGEVVQDGKVSDVDLMIDAGEEKVNVLPITVPLRGSCYIKFDSYTKKQQGMIPADTLMGFDQIQLDTWNNSFEYDYEERKQYGREVDFVEDFRFADIVSDLFQYRFDKFTGGFHSLSYQEEAVLTEPMQFNIWRAPTDNDMEKKKEWKQFAYHRVTQRACDSKVYKEENEVIITSEILLLADAIEWIAKINALYRINQAGKISMDFKVKKNPKMPDLPRFGMRMFLPAESKEVMYYGMGPNECYADKHQSCYVDLFRETVDSLHEDYIRPQENGSRYHCEYLELSGETDRVIAVTGNKFSFQLSKYSQEELEKKAHNFELCESGYSILCLDYAQSGIGSASCGPLLAGKYQVGLRPFEFSFCLDFLKKADGKIQ